MIGAGIAFAVMWALVRHGANELHAFQVTFFRFLFGALVMVPLILRRGGVSLRRRHAKLHGFNALAQLFATTMVFWAITQIPMAKVAALTFTSPLFVIVGAALILKEPVGPRRWGATIVGFAGTLLIVRPGVEVVSPAAILALLGAAFAAAAYIVTKSLARTDSPGTIVAYVSILMTIGALPTALTVWVWPSAQMLAWMAVQGMSGTIGLLCLAQSLRIAEASAVVPFRFLQMVFVSALGAILFDQQPDIWTWVGAAVIFGAGLYIARRESAIAKATS